MVNRFYKKKTKKSFENKHMKDIKISLWKEKKKGEKDLRQISKSF